MVDYRLRWMIRVGKVQGRCRPCYHKYGNKNITGLKLGHGWNKGLIGFNKGHPNYNPNTHLIFKGRNHTDKSKELMRLKKLGKCGELSNRWEGGLTKGQRIRMTRPHREWREKILKRDNSTCQFCGIKNVSLHVDHIKSFSGYPELRLDMNNGRVLCIPCHKKTPTYCKGKSFDVIPF